MGQPFCGATGRLRWVVGWRPGSLCVGHAAAQAAAGEVGQVQDVAGQDAKHQRSGGGEGEAQSGGDADWCGLG